MISTIAGKAWLKENVLADDAAAFPNRHERPLSRSGVEDRLHHAVTTAVEHCPPLKEKNVSPHTLRHTTAMHLLQAGVDMTVIALWLGHENCETTHLYNEADLEMKRRVLERIDALPVKITRRGNSDPLLDFLDGL